jgi:Protein of unknown function (DUF2799)
MRNATIQLRQVACLTVVALSLGGCASMSANECRTVDWRTVGYEDGAAGRVGDHIAQHRKACAKHGVSPDFARYQMGREEGLREYCKPSNGFRVGESGADYAGVCPVDIEDAFVSAYSSGHHLFTLQSRIAEAANQLDNRRRELNHLDEEITKDTATIVSSDTSAEKRSAALVETKRHAERAGRLKTEIRQLEKDKVRYELELEDYRATVATTTERPWSQLFFD